MKSDSLPLKNGFPFHFAGVTLQTVAMTIAGGLPQVAWTQSGVGQGISIAPRVSVSETYTNNVLLSSTDKQGELVTQVSPGIRIVSTGGRITGSLDYSLNELMYARNTSARRSENALNAVGKIEAIDKWAYIDFSGVIGQQSISAFGAPSSGGILLNGNSTETSVFTLSPHISGRLGGAADYEARYSLTSSQSKSDLVSSSDSKDLSVSLNGVGNRFGTGWTLAAAHHVIDYSRGRSTQTQLVSGQVSYLLNPQFGVYVKANHESSDLTTAANQQDNYTALGANWSPNPDARLSVNKDTRGATGYTASWVPSARTSVSATRERRLYGDTHSIVLAYRTPNTAWTFNDSRSVVTTPGQASGAGSASLYDLLFGQFAAGESDPVKREQYNVFLQANGIKPNATAVGGFLASSVSLQRQQQLSFALFGVRSTVTVILTRGQNSSLDPLSTVVDDFSTSSVVRQNGLSVNYSYRWTSRSVLSFAATRQNTTGSATQAGTSSRSVNVNLSTQLSKDTSANVGARHVVFSSSTAPYTETAVLGNLSLQF